MDDVAGERRRKGDAFPPPAPSASASLPALTPRGPGLLPLSPSSPSGSSFLPYPPPPDAAATVLALPARQPSVSGSPAAASTLPAGVMDRGSGEALLVRRSKPKKRAPPAEPHTARREFGGGDRALMLWRDYHDLLQETDAKKRRLESQKRRKLRLLAEVKFLRRRYDFLVKCNSQQQNYKLKGQARQIQSPVGVDESSALAEHAAGPSTSKSTHLELNQDSVMNNEGLDSRGQQGHPGPGNFDQDGVDEDTMTADVNFSVCSKDRRNSPSCEDERKISWQDHLALQV